MKILVTGGCGYIGSHTCVELINNNDEAMNDYDEEKIKNMISCSKMKKE